MGKAKQIVERYKTLKAEKDLWNDTFELVGEYVMYRKQHFTTQPQPGEMLNDQVFDDTAVNANTIMAAALIGAMWPNGAKSFQITMPRGMEAELGDETEEVRKYYERVTEVMADHMDNPKAGLMTALEEYMLDQGTFGISGIMTMETDDIDVPVKYKAVDAKTMFIEENESGVVDTILMHRTRTLPQMVERYGLESLSKENREAFLKGDISTKVETIHAIMPRREYDPHKFGVKNRPFASIHVELKTEKILKESGFWEFPVPVTRFQKAMGEKYGRSPAMAALPSILEANALAESWILAVEKTNDPALLVMDDSTMGGGVIDTSPGAINVVSVSGRLGNSQKPIDTLFTVGDLQWTATRRTELMEVIKNHFFMDRLLDLNNESRMTLGEANIRDRLRGQTLNPVYSRQFKENFVPTIENTFSALERKGLLGVVPGSQEEANLLNKGIIPFYIPEAVLRRIQQGREVYDIKFISPATRIMESQELIGIKETLQVGVETAGVRPDVLDNIDFDFAIKRIQQLSGAASELILATEAVKKLRKAREDAQAQQQDMMAAREMSETARNFGQAATSAGAA